ncbi:unnamed protein product [Sphagnum balticum]
MRNRVRRGTAACALIIPDPFGMRTVGVDIDNQTCVEGIIERRPTAVGRLLGRQFGRTRCGRRANLAHQCLRRLAHGDDVTPAQLVQRARQQWIAPTVQYIQASHGHYIGLCVRAVSANIAAYVLHVSGGQVVESQTRTL